MSTFDQVLERALFAFVGSRSGRTLAGLVLFLYGGIGLALPLALHFSTASLVMTNVIATLTAGLVILTWLTIQVQSSDRRHLVEWTTNLRLLTSAEFEWLVGELFRRQGWTVEETGRQDRADGNIDLRLTLAGERRVVQCKRWTSWPVGVDEIRRFAGTLMREGLSGSSGIFVTLSDFNEFARTEASQVGMTLINNRELHARIETARRAEPCELCNAPMKLDLSSRGWWLRCVETGCTGKRDLGSDPGRAVDLLLIRS